MSNVEDDKMKRVEDEEGNGDQNDTRFCLSLSDSGVEALWRQLNCSPSQAKSHLDLQPIAKLVIDLGSVSAPFLEGQAGQGV